MGIKPDTLANASTILTRFLNPIFTASGADAKEAFEDAVGTFITPDMSGSVHGSDDTTAILRARDKAAASGAALVLPRGIYTLSQKIQLLNVPLFVYPGAVLRAKAGSALTQLIQLGDPSSGSLSPDLSITNFGLIDANDAADVAIDAAAVNFCRIIGGKVSGANIKAVRIGDPAASQKSYEVDIQGLRAWYSQKANASGSIGVHHEYATDCYTAQAYSVGFRRGFVSDNACGSIDLTQCHAWVRPVHGVHDRSFYVGAGTSALNQCYSDTPTNYGNNSISDLACFELYGYNPVLTGCKAFMNTGYPGTDISTDGVVDVLRASREVYGRCQVTIDGSKSDRRWKTLFGGGGFGGTTTVEAGQNFVGGPNIQYFSVSQSTATYFMNSIRPLVATTTTLPSAGARANVIAMVSNPAAGKGRMVYSDGSAWRYVSDDSAV